MCIFRVFFFSFFAFLRFGSNAIFKGYFATTKKTCTTNTTKKKHSFVYRIQLGWDLHSRLVIIRIEANLKFQVNGLYAHARLIDLQYIVRPLIYGRLGMDDNLDNLKSVFGWPRNS